MNLKVAVVTFLSLCLVSPALGQVKADYDDGADFSAYKTYAWKPGTPAPSPFSEERIRNAVEAQLQLDGLTKAAQDPDLFVVTHASVHKEKRVDVTDYGYSGWYRRYPTHRSTSVNVYEVPIGTLVVDLVDAGTNKLIWRGTASAMTAKSPEKSEKRINKYVKRLFKKYPPR